MNPFSAINPFAGILSEFSQALGFPGVGNRAPSPAPPTAASSRLPFEVMVPQSRPAAPQIGARTNFEGVSSDDLIPDARAIARPAPRNAYRAGAGEVENYIRQGAVNRGMDPDKVIEIVLTEGGRGSLTNPYRKSEIIAKNGRREESYGPFQMYFGGGLGNRALKEAGVDARSNWRGGVDYALDYAAKNGWGEWYGPKNAGLPRDYGLKGSKALGTYAAADSSYSTNAADGPKGQEVYRRSGPAPTALAMGLPDEMLPPGSQRLPTGSGRSRSGSAGSGFQSVEAAGFEAPDPRTPIGRAYQAYKVNRSTRLLRGLSPAATIGVLTALGQSARMRREEELANSAQEQQNAGN